jgi:hypothetical protein
MEGSVGTTYETMEDSIITALHYAAERGDEEMVTEIYEYALGKGLSNEELDALYEKVIDHYDKSEDLGYLKIGE